MKNKDEFCSGLVVVVFVWCEVVLATVRSVNRAGKHWSGNETEPCA